MRSAHNGARDYFAFTTTTTTMAWAVDTTDLIVTSESCCGWRIQDVTDPLICLILEFTGQWRIGFKKSRRHEWHIRRHVWKWNSLESGGSDLWRVQDVWDTSTGMSDSGIHQRVGDRIYEESKTCGTHLQACLTVEFTAEWKNGFILITFCLQITDAPCIPADLHMDRWSALSLTTISTWECLMPHWFTVSFRQSLYRLYCLPACHEPCWSSP